MSSATVVRSGRGVSDRSNFYIKCRNGSVYRYAHPVTDEIARKLTCKLDETGFRVQVRGRNVPWVHVRKPDGSPVV